MMCVFSTGSRRGGERRRLAIATHAQALFGGPGSHGRPGPGGRPRPPHRRGSRGASSRTPRGHAARLLCKQSLIKNMAESFKDLTKAWKKVKQISEKLISRR